MRVTRQSRWRLLARRSRLLARRPRRPNEKRQPKNLHRQQQQLIHLRRRRCFAETMARRRTIRSCVHNWLGCRNSWQIPVPGTQPVGVLVRYGASACDAMLYSWSECGHTASRSQPDELYCTPPLFGSTALFIFRCMGIFRDTIRIGQK